MDKTQKINFKTVDEYLLSVPGNARKILEEIRKATKQVVPEAVEVISYNMPAFKYHGVLLYFAAHKEHVGFYPGSADVIEVFGDELQGFETSKGTIKLPLDKTTPKKLIKAIIEYRVNENLERSKSKLKGKK
jgi:uncharacterized protein YdhG (YjbR/CyaY superfamily)